MLRNVIAAVAVIGSAVGLSACGFSNGGQATIIDRYVCQQAIGNQVLSAYCIDDSYGNSYYVPYSAWRRTAVGQYENKYIPVGYTTGKTARSVPANRIPSRFKSVINGARTAYKSSVSRSSNSGYRSSFHSTSRGK